MATARELHDVIVETRYGAVRGRSDGTVCVWKGVPFARPPVGPLRFRPPEPPEPWSGVRDATRFGPASVQPEDRLISNLTGGATLPQDEDCLYLNIWSPSPDGRRPVMVWIHGGAYLTGAGSIPWYDGTALAREGDVVVVTLNYRLGALGFLYLEDAFGPEFTGSGNLGILDQIAALRWVRENIAAFGGDPDRVTIFGESAGAGSVGVLLAAPAARGLFHRAILQSGSGALGVRTAASAARVAARVLQHAGVEPGDREALRSLPARAWANAVAALGPGLPLGPVVDGTVLPEHPMAALARGAARDVAVLVGVNKDEYNLFALQDPAWLGDDEAALRQRVEAVVGPAAGRLIEFYRSRGEGSLGRRLLPLMSYAVFVRGMLATADAQARVGAPVWAYRFDFETPVLGGVLGACHALEIPFVFNTLDRAGADRFTGTAPERYAVAQAMHRAWIAFAREGNPQHDGLPEWPRYDLEERAVMVFAVEPRVERDPWRAEREVWAAAGVGA
ncbi:Carboxylesterase type B [Thermaerobacter marianensis DSM 12885]|uniref:Carboxylic ester hydrolase n=2 Tax=Thermaerobacter marianensis (strain ATCC 700841 / DSM 12885 / JCM 10246 / 7p75a) TaxID=644966 RepID=E6SHQ4_THEM7|nr:carboxylesterase/lipase family protein [Thermaerobacter marianensis]ADU50751.1 Carboxylesterase type B [Thermaerobacter marianensis DSM 12885]